MHRLWQKLETAAFSPKLLQIGWPLGSNWKESLLKWLPKGHSPQTLQVGGGTPQWARRLTLVHSFWMSFFQCFSRCFFWAFGRHFGGSGCLFCVTLGYFSELLASWVVFLRIALPCRRELKNQGPGVTEIAQKSNKKCIWLWDCFGKPVSKEIIQFGLKHAQKGTPNWTPKLA